MRVNSGGVSQTGTASGSDGAAEAARRAAEEARRAAEEAMRRAQQAAAEAERARAQLQAASTNVGPSRQPGADPQGGLKLEQRSVAADANARQLATEARNATQHANTTALAAGRPAPFPAGPSLRNTLLADGGDFSGRPKASLFGTPSLGATPANFRADAGAVTGPSTAAPAAAATGATTVDEARTNLVDAKQSYDDAHKKTAELNEKLNQELAKLGPALTDAQKQQYVQEFRESHPDEFAAEEAAAKKLNDALNDPKLLEAAKNNPDVAKESVDAAKSLAESPQAKGALEWAAKAMDPQGPAGTAFEGLKDQIDEDVTAPALSTAAGQLLTENGGDAQAALKALTELTQPLVPLSKGGAALKNGIQTIKAALDSGDPNPLRQLSQSGGKLGTALAGVGVAFGLASAATDAARGEWGKVVKDLANAGRSGAQAAAAVMRTLGESGRIAAQTGEKAAQFLSRLAPALGVVANSVVLAEHFKDFLDDPSVGGGVQAFGDAVAVVGAGLGTVLPGVGQIVEGVGLVLSALGGLIVGKEKQEALDNESEGILKQMGMDPDVAKTLAHGDEQPERLSKDLGLSPEQIQDVAKRYPTLFDAPGLGQAAIDAAKACGMKGQDAVGFIDAMAKDNGDFAWDLLGVKPMIQGDGTHPTSTDDSWRAYVQGRYPTAYAHAQEHAPDLFGASAESRLRADRDFEQNAGMMDFPLTYARLCDKNKGDEAYTSEFIHRMKDNGYLDNFVRFIDQNGLDMDRSGAKAALDAALKTGVLSEADVQGYLNGGNGDAWRSILGR
ncbi:phage tail tape measure protein [Corallococcus silvisoli]|uniref:hypothetical protein n=1 Tax=Corallococcus silvisoli TaxID=2697031 RepID=UPI001F1F2BF9|nr:hypothetical protein [Corallococcus silvisoli]